MTATGVALDHGMTATGAAGDHGMTAGVAADRGSSVAADPSVPARTRAGPGTARSSPSADRSTRNLSLRREYMPAATTMERDDSEPP